MSSPRWNHVLEHLAQQTAPSDWTDAQLLEVFCTRRDEAAFEAIVTRHGAMVRSVCQRALSNPSDVEDVVQATFFTLAQKASSIRNRASLGNWLHGVAHRLALKVVRGLRVSHTLTEAEDQGTSDPLDAMTARELCTALDEELQRLPTDGQSAIVLCCLEGLTRDEAAQQMGWTLSKLKFWLQKGRELLRSRLQNRGVSLPAFLGTTLVPLAIAEVPSEMKRSIAKLSTQMLQTPLSQMQLSPRIKTLVEGALKSMTHQPFRALLASLTLILMLGMGVMLLAQDKKKPKLLKDPSKIVKKKKPGPVTHVKLLGQLHHEKAVHEIAISPDGRSIITGAFGCKSQIWDVATMKPRNTPQSHYGDVCSVAFSGDGRFALTSDWRDAQVWDVATGKKRGKALPHWMREDTVVGPAISPDGTRVATRATKTTSQLWDVATGKPIGKPIQQGGTVVELRFSADSRALFIRGGKGPFLQNARTGEQMVRKFKHKGYVSDVAFSRDGRLIATASPDKTVKVWDVRTGKLVGKPLVHDEGVRRVGKECRSRWSPYH